MTILTTLVKGRARFIPRQIITRPIMSSIPDCKDSYPSPHQDNDSGDRPRPENSQFIKEETVASGKWIALKNITYRNAVGQERLWEAVYRTTRTGTQDKLDAVVVIPVLKRLLKYDCVVLVKQYRPPMKCCTLEFPAGLIDPNETPEQTAVRELREETGYTGEIVSKSPVTCLDPGVGNATVSILTAEIDGDDPVNKKPTPNLDDTEFIDVITVPLDELHNTLDKYSGQGVVVDTRVYTYAIAMAQTKGRVSTSKPIERIDSSSKMD